MNQTARYRTHVFPSFNGLPQPYLDLLAKAPSFDQTAVWYGAFEQYLLTSEEQLNIVALEDSAGRPVAILPLRSDKASRGALAVRAASSLTNYYSALFGPVFAADADVPGATAALCSSLRTLQPHWNRLDLNPLAHEHPFFEAARRSLREAGCVVQPYFRFGNWYLEVGGRKFAQYMEGMPGRMRSTLTRKSKKLRARPDTTIEIIQEPERVAEAMDAYESIYTKSWKQDEPHKDFIREIAQRFAAEGWLRLGLVRIGGQPAAAQIWYVYGGTASIFKLAYDPVFAEHSVGSVLTMKLMEHALDVDGVAVVDYLCGDDDYKKDWMSHRRERWGLRASPWRSLVGMSEVAHAVGSRLKSMATRAAPEKKSPQPDEAAA